MMDGAKAAMNAYDEPSLQKNPAYQYAAVRNILYTKGKTIEMLVNYEPIYNIFLNGGNNYLVKVKEKIKVGFFQHLQTSQQTYIP